MPCFLDAVRQCVRQTGFDWCKALCAHEIVKELHRIQEELLFV